MRPSNWPRSTAARVPVSSSTACWVLRAHRTEPQFRRAISLATVYERVRKIVVDQLGVEEDQVVPAASFVDDLNADSLDLVELIMSLEEEFSKGGKAIEISDEDAEKIVTVQDAVDYITELGVE